MSANFYTILRKKNHFSEVTANDAKFHAYLLNKIRCKKKILQNLSYIRKRKKMPKLRRNKISAQRFFIPLKTLSFYWNNLLQFCQCRLMHVIITFPPSLDHYQENPSLPRSILPSLIWELLRHYLILLYKPWKFQSIPVTHADGFPGRCKEFLELDYWIPI